MFNLSNLLASLVGIAMAISIHEFGHAYSAHLLGDDTAKYNGRMTLNPAKHVDPLGLIMLILCHFGWAKPVPVNPNNFKNYKIGNIIVSLSGALGNLIGAIICALIVKYVDMYAIQVIFDIHFSGQVENKLIDQNLNLNRINLASIVFNVAFSAQHRNQVIQFPSRCCDSKAFFNFFQNRLSKTGF